MSQDIREIASIVNAMCGAISNGEDEITWNVPEADFQRVWQWAQETQSSLPTEQERAIAALIDAIKVEGPNPMRHRWVMGETRKSWPTLMQAVDRVLAAFSRPKSLDVGVWWNSL